MRKILFARSLLPVIFYLLGIFSLTFAADRDIVKIQGALMVLDPGQSMMVINEKTFFWNRSTNFYDEKGLPITLDKLGVKSWVYVVAQRDAVTKKVMAEKIYLLPKFIDAKEKHLYPFIQ